MLSHRLFKVQVTSPYLLLLPFNFEHFPCILISIMASMTPLEGLDLLKSGWMADYTIKCADTSFPVNRVIIGTKSRFLKTFVEGQFELRIVASLLR